MDALNRGQGLTRRRWLAMAGMALAPARGYGDEKEGRPCPVLEWNDLVLQVARKETTAPDLLASRMAVLHAGIHRAVTVPGAPADSAGQLHAVAGAAGLIATTLYPSGAPRFEELLQRQRSAGPAKNGADAMTAGRKAAGALLEERKADGTAVALSYVPSTAPGQWRRTPPTFRPPELPRWAETAKPFALRKFDQFRPSGPPALNSPEYARAFNEIKAIGAKQSPNRTEHQAETAKFWSDFSYTETPAGHWNSIARSLAKERALTCPGAARLFMLLNVAMADAGIAAWDAKYHYNFWRPVTAITRAEEDGNEATPADANWLPLLNTPPHPEYVSGHSAFSGAAAEILRDYFKTAKIPVKAESDALPKARRAFPDLDTCLEEIANSRIWGGIHFRFSCDAGRALGKAVAGECLKRFAE